MATIQSPINTYSDTTPQKRGVSDLITLISPKKTPLLAYFGIQTDFGDMNVVGWPNTKFELLSDELQPQTDTLNGSITSTATTVTFTDADAFTEGDVIVVDSEYIYLSSRSAGGEIWTVARSFGGTTNASHDTAAVVTRISNARVEGADTYDGPVQDITSITQYTQIIHRGVKVSRTQAKIAQYGIDDYYEYQVMKHKQEALIDLEKALIRAKLSSGSGTVARMMGGFDYWVNSAGGNTVSAGGAVVQADFEDALEAIYNDGGDPSDAFVAYLSSANMQVIKNIYDNSQYLRVDRGENTVGMVVDRVETPFGSVDLLMSQFAQSSIIPIINPDHFRVVAFDDFQEETLAKSGDYKRGQIVGEFTVAVREPLKAHGEIVAIS